MKRLWATVPAALLLMPVTGCFGASPETQKTAPAMTKWKGGEQVRVEGRVIRLLADDRDGSPHQRFIIEIDNGSTLLIAHNLDLAPRLAGLTVGERVIVAGEYEPNERGGMVHWTHDDPKGLHPAGYVEWRGRRYQ